MVGDKKRRVWEKETIHWRCQQASGPTEISGWIYSLSKMSPHETLLKGFSWCGLVNGQEKGKEKMISEHFGSRRQEEPRTGRASQKSVSLPGARALPGEQMRGKSVLRNPERNWHLCAPSSGLQGCNEQPGADPAGGWEMCQLGPQGDQKAGVEGWEEATAEPVCKVKFIVNKTVW